MTGPVPSKELKFSWTWDADARTYRISTIDMGDGLVAGYDHLAGYYERRLIEEIDRLRTTLTGIATCGSREACQGAATRALRHAERTDPIPDDIKFAMALMGLAQPPRAE